jgi:hypothetical protein
MRTRLSRTTVLHSLLLLASCGSKNGGMTNGSCDDIHTARLAAAQAAAKIECAQRLPRCFPSSMDWSSEADCEAAWVRAVFASNFIYLADPDVYVQCLHDRESAAWNCLSNPLDRCTQIVRGKLARDATCISTTQCADGLNCGVSERTCVPAPGAGSGCDPALAMCDTSMDLVCSTARSCVTAPTLGEPCPDSLCDPNDSTNLVCSPAMPSQAPTCHPLATAAGDACVGTGTCADSLYCGADMKCAPVLAEGMGCDPTADVGQCDRSMGLACDAQAMRCVFGFARLGEHCDASKPCWQSFCPASGMCRPFDLEGQSCSEATSCIPPLVCPAGLCTQPPNYALPGDSCPEP